MLTKGIFSKGHKRIDWNSLQLSPRKLNLGIFPSGPTNGINMTVVFVQC